MQGSVYAQLLPSCFLPVGVSGCRMGTMGVEDCVLRFCPSAEPEPILEIGDSEPSSTLVGALREGGEGEGIRKGEERVRHRWEVISSPAPTPKSLSPHPSEDPYSSALCRDITCRWSWEVSMGGRGGESLGGGEPIWVVFAHNCVHHEAICRVESTCREGESINRGRAKLTAAL